MRVPLSVDGRPGGCRDTSDGGVGTVATVTSLAPYLEFLVGWFRRNADRCVLSYRPPGMRGPPVSTWRREIPRRRGRTGLRAVSLLDQILGRQKSGKDNVSLRI